MTKSEKDRDSSKECPITASRNSKSLGDGKSEGEASVKTLQDPHMDVSILKASFKKVRFKLDRIILAYLGKKSTNPFYGNTLCCVLFYLFFCVKLLYLI